MEKDVECPYCGAGQDVCHDGGYGMEEGVKHNMNCGVCDKNFVYETTITISHEAAKADCLNDDKHDYKPTTTYPKKFTKMECSMCGDRRRPTEGEMKLILS